MKITLASALLALATGTGSAQAPDWSHPTRIDVALSSFRFEPAALHLHHGQVYLLHVRNVSDGGHDFVAKDFFAQAQLAPSSRATVKNGEIELHGGDAADVVLVAPAAGTYAAHCSHFMHEAMGMKGAIIVD